MGSLLWENNILSVIVSSNSTDFPQPLDISINKTLKDHLRCSVQFWYSQQVSKQLEEGKEPDLVDTRLSVMNHHLVQSG